MAQGGTAGTRFLRPRRGRHDDPSHHHRPLKLSHIHSAATAGCVKHLAERVLKLTKLRNGCGSETARGEACSVSWLPASGSKPPTRVDAAPIP